MALTPTNARYTASVARIATKDNYISTLDIQKPDRAEDFVKRYGTQNLTGLLEALGNKAAVTNRTFTHYEEDYIHNYIEVDTTATITTAATQVEVLVKAEVDIDGTGSGAARSGARLGDVLLLSDGSLGLVVGIKTAAGGDHASGSSHDGYSVTFSLTPTVAKEAIVIALYDGAGALTLTADDKLPIVGNEWAEGTNQPEGLTPKPITYNNNVMIMKESFEVSGTEATNMTWVKVQGADGKEGYLWYLKGENDTYMRMQNYCEIMGLIGAKATGTAITAAGYKGSEGLLTNIESNGTVVDPGTITDWDTEDIDDMVKALDRERGAKENALYCGIDLALKLDDVLANFNAGTVGQGTSFRFGQFAMGADVDFGFVNFTRGGYKFNKSTYDPFNYTGMLGSASGANFKERGFVVPMDTRRDAKSGEAIPSLRMRYKEVGPYSREMEHWFTGSAVLADPTNETDNLKCHYRTERGLEVFGGNRFLYLKS